MRIVQYIGAFAFGVCALSAQASSPTSAAIAPVQAIQLAAKATPLGVRGTFAMRVAATGHANGHVFLNSEVDYRDPANLSIDIAPWILGRLERRFGAPPETFFKGKQIVVRGTVRRVPIKVLEDDGRTIKGYYFQTHVDVLQPSQISLAESFG